MIKVSQAHDLYLSRQDFADSSKALKGRAVKFFIGLCGDLAVDAVKKQHIDTFKSMLVRQGRRKSSANIYLCNLAPFFGWLRDDNYIDENPFAGWRKYTPEQRVRTIYDDKELYRLFAVGGLEWKTLIALSACCSLRRGECLNVVRDDIKDGWLHICSKKQTRQTWSWNIKNHAEALIKLPKFRMEDIEVDLGAWLIELGLDRPTSQPYLLVSPRQYRKQMHLLAENSLSWELRNCPVGNFSRAWNRLQDKAGVKKRRFQDLRGTYATILRKSGMGLDEVSRLMRHKNINTTLQFYLRYDQAELAVKSNNTIEKFYASCVL